MKTVIGLGLAALMTTAAPAFANPGPRDASIDQRQHALVQRIEQGRHSGELTPREYQRLVSEAREVNRVEHYFRSDGWLSPRERGDLHARLDRLERVVYREKHDGQRLSQSHRERVSQSHRAGGSGFYNRGYPTDRRY